MGLCKSLALKLESNEHLTPAEANYVKFLKTKPVSPIQLEFNFKSSENKPK